MQIIFHVLLDVLCQRIRDNLKLPMHYSGVVCILDDYMFTICHNPSKIHRSRYTV